MPRALAPDDLYRFRIPTDPRVSPDGSHALVTLQTSAPEGRRLPPRGLARAARCGRRRAAPADDRCPQRRQRPLVAGRPDDRVPLGPAPPDRGGAGRARQEGPRGRHAGPPALARRRRGAAADRPAARRRRLRVVAGRVEARRHHDVAPGEPQGRPKGARPRPEARAHRPARVGLSLHRPARLHAQRARLHLRLGLAPLDRGCRDRGGDAADRRTGVRRRSGLVARRHADRLHDAAEPRLRPVLPVRHRRRRRRIGHADADHRRPGADLLRAGVAARRQDDRDTRRPPAPQRLPQRRLAVLGRWQGSDAQRRAQHLRPARHHAGLRHEQRHHARRGLAADPVGRRPLAVVPRTTRRRLPAVADRGRRWRPRAADRRSPLPVRRSTRSSRGRAGRASR